MQSAIPEVRGFSRELGASRLRAEAAAFGFSVAGGIDHIRETARDVMRGRLYGASQARQWVRGAQGKTTRAAAANANHASRHALERLAVTESAEAYNAGRTGAAQSIVETTELLKVWDAQLDACPFCRQANGTIVGIRERFPHGEPGAVHVLCRCTFSLLVSRTRGGRTMITPTKLRTIPRAAAP